MITFRENTTLIGVSELRNSIEKILKKAKESLIIIEKRHKRSAVLMSNKEYEHMQHTIDIAEDIVLGSIARQRYNKSSKSDYINIEELL